MPNTKTDNSITRPPVVVVMGHVDHGKSKLLDYIRKSNIVEGEAGGITQHIGAYEVIHFDSGKKEKKITFLDTPGHEAFSMMRSRGAKVADVAILVVAADEGVKQQTIEAYKQIEKEKIPFVVAINKIDKPNANPEQIKTELGANNIFVESYGGKIPSVNVSAQTGAGIDELLETLLLVVEMEELKANSENNASGVVIESHLDSRRGVSATLLILDGTIKKGEFVVVEDAISPVRIFEDFLGNVVEEKTFSSPIKITGFSSLPKVGAKFATFKTKKEAEQAVALHSLTDNTTITKEKVSAQVEIPLVIKADVLGTTEAIENEINKLNGEEVAIKILKLGVGNINKDDAKIASSAQNSYIVGFNVKTDNGVKDFAERLSIEIKNFDIIYKIKDWLAEEILKIKERLKKEDIAGEVKILKIFGEKDGKQIIGGKVIKGIIKPDKEFNLKRRGNTVSEGKIISLQSGAEKVEMVSEGAQFGAIVKAKIEVVENDCLEIFGKLD